MYMKRYISFLGLAAILSSCASSGSSNGGELIGVGGMAWGEPNPYGMVHGGAIYTLADNAAGTAAHSDGRYYVTQTSALHFLRNQARGTVRAAAYVRHRGKSTVLTAVDITGEGGKLLATGEFTFFCVDKDLMDRKAAAEQE